MASKRKDYRSSLKLLADQHISPKTVLYLNSIGYDTVRVSEVMPCNASDDAIWNYAKRNNRVIITQDLDFSRIVALSKDKGPSIITLRLASSKIENVNNTLKKVLSKTENELSKGVIITADEARIRIRELPV